MATTITRYQPQTTPLTRLPDLVDRLFRDSFAAPSFWDRSVFGGASRAALPVNLFETPEEYIMHCALPGMKPENLDIQVVGREVTVKGTYELNTPENGQWVWQGIPSGEFYETFTLPVEIESDKVQASYDHGILTLGLPKAEHLRPKSIKVQASK
jgi:HSP20 family protein